jgi:hypothetical protein
MDSDNRGRSTPIGVTHVLAEHQGAGGGHQLNRPSTRLRARSACETTA